MKSEIINAKIEKRILVTDAPIFSGETVKIRLEIDAADAVASEHKIILFGDDKTALAEGTFSASESAWIADLNTATREMAAYFEGVPVDATKSVGAMVVNTITADVITRGNVLVVSTPFPENLSPCPQTYAYLTVEEFSSSMAEVETEISGKADSSDFIQLSNTVADLSSAMASKADSSTVADLSSAVGDASLIVRRSQYGGVGIGGEVKALTLTGADDEYPMLEFNDEARGGDYYVFMSNGPEASGGNWHELNLPNHDGYIGLVPSDTMAQPVIDAPPKLFDKWGRSGNETKRITVTPSNYFDFERSRYTCGNWGEGVKKLVFDFSGIKSQTDIEVVDIRLYMYVCGEALPTDVFYIDGFNGMDSFYAWNGANNVPLQNAIDVSGNYAYAIDVHFNESFGLSIAQIIGQGEY